MSKASYGEYKDYLQSDHWQQLVTRYIKKNPRAHCFVCNKRYTLLPHHVSYLNLGKERINKDIYIVCWDHHHACHFLFGFIKIPLRISHLLPRLYFLKSWYSLSHGRIIPALFYGIKSLVVKILLYDVKHSPSLRKLGY
jgi:hypothetical protein